VDILGGIFMNKFSYTDIDENVKEYTDFSFTIKDYPEVRTIFLEVNTLDLNKLKNSYTKVNLIIEDEVICKDKIFSEYFKRTDLNKTSFEFREVK
jgi:hypothetical protein